MQGGAEARPAHARAEAAWRPAPARAASTGGPALVQGGAERRPTPARAGTDLRPVPAPLGTPQHPAAEHGGTVWRPLLARGVVLRHDRVRGADLLLLPERVVVLHGRAGRVLGLCDGCRTVDGIVAELCADFPGAPVASEVPEFLHRLCEEGWLA